MPYLRLFQKPRTIHNHTHIRLAIASSCRRPRPRFEVHIRLHFVHPRHRSFERKLFLHPAQQMCGCGHSPCAWLDETGMSKEKGMAYTEGEERNSRGSPAVIPRCVVATGATPPDASTSRRRPPPAAMQSTINSIILCPARRVSWGANAGCATYIAYQCHICLLLPSNNIIFVASSCYISIPTQNILILNLIYIATPNESQFENKHPTLEDGGLVGAYGGSVDRSPSNLGGSSSLPWHGCTGLSFIAL
jgi:hypothetical protein